MSPSGVATVPVRVAGAAVAMGIRTATNIVRAKRRRSDRIMVPPSLWIAFLREFRGGCSVWASGPCVGRVGKGTGGAERLLLTSPKGRAKRSPLSLWERVGVRATAVELTRPHSACAHAPTPTLPQRGRESRHEHTNGH